MATCVRKSGNNCRDCVPAACLKWIGSNFSPASIKNPRETKKKQKLKNPKKLYNIRNPYRSGAMSYLVKSCVFLCFFVVFLVLRGFLHCLCCGAAIQSGVATQNKRPNCVSVPLFFQLDRVKVCGCPFWVLREAPSHTYCVNHTESLDQHGPRK